MLLVIVMHLQEMLVTCTMSKKMAGNLSVYTFLCLIFFLLAYLTGFFLSGNYDISEMHYNGPGNVPGASTGGYGYDIRVKDLSSADSRSSE